MATTDSHQLDGFLTCLMDADESLAMSLNRLTKAILAAKGVDGDNEMTSLLEL